MSIAGQARRRPNGHVPAKMFLGFLVSIFLLLQLTDGFIFETTCRHDRQCIRRNGMGSCCAPRRPIFSPLPVCKPAGQRDDWCQMSGERLPYPTSLVRRRYLFTCPCATGLRCQRYPGYNDIGTCVA